MKLFSNLVGMALAGTLGYLAEPSLRVHLTGMAPGSTKIASRGAIPETTSPPATASAPAPTPAPPAQPAPTVQDTVPPTPAPPAPAPISPPVPIPDVAPLPNAGDVVLKLMQDSIKSGQIQEFTFDKVTGWRVGGEETVDGVSYQTGIATYPMETVFGISSLEAKALIKDGRIQRWIRPKTGLEIK